MKLPPVLTKLTAREKKIFYIASFFVFVLFAYHGLWHPASEKFAELEDETFVAEMRLRKAKTLVRQKDDILEEAKKYPNLAQLDAGTDEEETARLLNLIEQTARKNGVSLSDVKPESVKTDKWTKRFEVGLQAESNLQQMIDFVYELEHSPQLLKIEKVEMNLKDDKSSVIRSQLTVARTVTK